MFAYIKLAVIYYIIKRQLKITFNIPSRGQNFCNSTSIHDKISIKCKIEETFLNIIKSHLLQPTMNIFKKVESAES